MSLVDRIIEHQPWAVDAVCSLNGADMERLRDELLEFRRLQAVAEALDRAAREMRANYRTGDKSIEYISGFEDATSAFD